MKRNFVSYLLNFLFLTCSAPLFAITKTYQDPSTALLLAMMNGKSVDAPANVQVAVKTLPTVAPKEDSSKAILLAMVKQKPADTRPTQIAPPIAIVPMVDASNIMLLAMNDNPDNNANEETTVVATNNQNPDVVHEATTMTDTADTAQTANNDDGSVQKQAAPQRGIETFLQDQNIALTKRFTIEADLTYTSYNRKNLTLNGFLALDSIFLGDLSINDVRANKLTLDLIGRYAFNDNVQVAIDIPYVYRSTTFVKNGVGGDANASVSAQLHNHPIAGDASTSLFVSAIDEAENIPGIIWNLQAVFPTGKSPYGIKTKDISPDGLTTFIIPTNVPSGNGVYSVITGFSFTKTVDPAVIFANINWRYNFIRHFSNINSAQNKQPGSVKLGSAVTYGMGIAYALNDRTSISLAYSQQISRADQIKAVGGPWATQDGSDVQPASLNTSFTYGITESLAMIAVLQAGLNQDAPDLVAGIKFPFSF